jgi:hypothetical protein
MVFLDLTKIIAVSAGFFMIAQSVAAKTAGSQQSALLFNQVGYTHVSHSKNIVALIHVEKYLIEVTREQTILKTPLANDFYKVASNKIDLAKSEKIDFPEAMKDGRWMPMGRLKDGILLFLEPWLLDVVAFDLAKNEVIAKKSLILDRLKPAKDSRGEPTGVEIDRLRKEIVRQYQVMAGQQFFAGVSLLKEDGKAKDTQFILLSRIKQAPIMIASCSKETVGYCQIERSCFWSEPKATALGDLLGLGFSAKHKTAIIGDRKNHQLKFYRFNSCFDMVYQKTMDLPLKIKPVNSVSVDQTDGIWISSDQPDGYTNSPIYYWSSSRWR